MHKKFSLIELLVVVAIIAILASLLLPSLKKAREKSKSAVCKSNLHQLGLGVSMYADDNEGRIPYSGNFTGTNQRWWNKVLKDFGYIPETEAAMTCPSLPYPGDWTTRNYNTYGAPRLAGRTGEISITGFSGFSITEVESPSEFFWYADSAKRVDGSLVQWNNYKYHEGATMRIHTRHDEKANLWFADGHVSSHSITFLKQLGIGYVWSESGTALNF